MKLSQVLIECTLRETVCILSPILPQKIFNIKLFLNTYNLTLIFKPTVMALPPNEDNCFIRLLAYAFEFLPPPLHIFTNSSVITLTSRTRIGIVFASQVQVSDSRTLIQPSFRFAMRVRESDTWLAKMDLEVLNIPDNGCTYKLFQYVHSAILLLLRRFYDNFHLFHFVIF